ncbi:T-complex protein 11-domain-containing protein [Blastocladiella britannica]|nr:T-complex protein 11-domain-containing protein [Blastocladiella britannica]
MNESHFDFADSFEPQAQAMDTDTTTTTTHTRRSSSPTSVAFFIDVSQLALKANKPRHIAQRFEHDEGDVDNGGSSVAAASAFFAARFDRRPHHLSTTTPPTTPAPTRRRGRSPGPAALLASPDSDDAAVVDACLVAAASKRQRLLDERRAKLASHHERVEDVARTVATQRASAARGALAHLEDTLQAAARSREETLGARATRGSEEVTKAKRVAARRRGEVELKTRRAREEIAAKLLSSSWRRQQIMRMPRTLWTASPQVVADRVRDMAASIIQGWWRAIKVAPAVDEMRKLVTPSTSTAPASPAKRRAAAAASPVPVVASPSADTTPVSSPVKKSPSKRSPGSPNGPAVVPPSLRGALDLNKLSSMPFPNAAAVLQKPSVIRVTSRFLQRTKRCAVDPPELGKTPTRAFLTVFMVLAHRGAIIDNAEGALEKELIGTAHTLHSALQALLSVPVLPPTGAATAMARADASATYHTAISSFLQAWFAYHTTFEAFKSKDTQGVIGNLVAHATELARILANVATVNHDATDAEWRPSIVKQLRVMRQRLYRVGGDAAVQQLTDALEPEGLAEVLDEAMRDGATASSVASRAMSPARPGSAAGTASDAMDVTGGGNGSDSVLVPSPAKRAMLARAASPSPSTSPARPSSLRRASGSGSSPPPVPAVPHMAAIRQPSPLPGFDDLDDDVRGGAVGEILANHALAHEVVMDPEFTISGSTAANPLARAVKAAAQRAFAERLDALAAEGDWAFLADLVGEVRDALVSMVAPSSSSPSSSSAPMPSASSSDEMDMATAGSATAAAIRSSLDPDRLRAEIAHANGAIDAAQVLGTVVSWMQRLAAPARDADIAALSEMPGDAPGATVVAVHAVLENMRLDMANYHLAQLRPILAARAVEYEQRKFSAFVDAVGAEAALERTRVWLEQAARALLATTHQRNPEGLPLSELTRPKFEDVYTEALLSLVSPTATTGVSPHTAPETLALDARRLFDMQNRAQAITVTSALVMVARNAVPWMRSAELPVRMPHPNALPGGRTMPDVVRLVPAAQVLADRLLALLSPSTASLSAGRRQCEADEEWQAPTAAHLATAVMAIAGEAMPRQQHTASSDSSMSSAEAIARLSEAQRDSISSLVAKTVAGQRDPVLAIVSRRVHAAMRTYLGMSAAATMSPSASPARPLSPTSNVRLRRDSLSANGLDVVEEELNRLGARLAAVAGHNKAVYAPWYDQILGRALTAAMQ